MQNFLVELGCEELPPKSLKQLANAFKTNLADQLNNAKIGFADIEVFASPRRLALKVNNLNEFQADQENEKRGPAIAAAFDSEGNPSKAALGWAASLGIEVASADRLKTDKGEWLYHLQKIKGQATTDLIADLIKEALKNLPIAKPMRWGDKNEYFIRPVHTLTMLYGDKLVDGTILGVKSARTILGHRFMGQASFELSHADNYAQDLREKGCVIASFEERKAIISREVSRIADELNLSADLDPALLDEVCALVEYPVALKADFEPHFLKVPSEALVYTMKGDQKYFPLYSKNAGSKLTNLAPHFIFIANIDPSDKSLIIKGNEKVVRPRLSDAEFFFETDCKKPLIDNLAGLKNVLFQQQLGTLFDKAQRLSALSGFIGTKLGEDEILLQRAGLLAKCDLLTNMVFEFTDTQGIMGMYYASLNGENPKVAKALKDQYLPRFAGDELPDNKFSCALALAEKFDTLVGIFGIGQNPKGDKDPFALRRGALGILRIFIENELALDLKSIIVKACELYGERLTNPEVVSQTYDFILARIKAMYLDLGFSGEEINAVLATEINYALDFDRKIKALKNFLASAQAPALAHANKRVANILSKEKQQLSGTLDLTLCVEVAEKSLAELVLKLTEELQGSHDYLNILTQLSQLQQPVDDFFDAVKVNSDDPKLRNNRLLILTNLRQLFLKVADISLL